MTPAAWEEAGISCPPLPAATPEWPPKAAMAANAAPISTRMAV